MESRFETCCQNCGMTDVALIQCPRCHVVSYCSHSCKVADVESHGRVCFEKIKKNKPEPVSTIIGYNVENRFASFFLFLDSEYYTKDTLLRVMRLFPFYDVITDFPRIPHLNMQQTKSTELVLLTQIHKNEEHSKNIFIKDIFGSTLYVIFNIKSSNPFFNWTELKPGKMICFENPMLYTFACNLVLCINNPVDIRIL